LRISLGWKSGWKSEYYHFYDSVFEAANQMPVRQWVAFSLGINFSAQRILWIGQLGGNNRQMRHGYRQQAGWKA
jgi:hypothetical protein